jgi:hypothetical protein
MKVRDRWWPPAPAPVTVPEPRSLRSSWAPLIWRACEGAVTRLRPLISQLAREHLIASARRRRRVAVLFREQRPDRGLPPIGHTQVLGRCADRSFDVNGFQQCDLTRPDAVIVSKVEANGKVRILS